MEFLWHMFGTQLKTFLHVVFSFTFNPGDWLSNAFRLALLNGNMDEAVAIHATGNINLTCAFSNVKGELFYVSTINVKSGSTGIFLTASNRSLCTVQ